MVRKMFDHMNDISNNVSVKKIKLDASAQNSAASCKLKSNYYEEISKTNAKNIVTWIYCNLGKRVAAHYKAMPFWDHEFISLKDSVIGLGAILS